MSAFDNEEHWYGSARAADKEDLARAGLFARKADSVFAGFFEERPILIGGQGGLITCAGARSGKLRDVLGYNICGNYFGSHKIILDLKGELWAVSQDRTSEGRCIHAWNPMGGFGPQDRINPLSHLTIQSPALVSRAKVFAENVLPLTGSATAEFFEMRGQEVIEAFSLTLAERDDVASLPALYDVINLAAAPSDAWLEFAFLMSESRFPLARRIEQEIAAFHKSGSDAMRGILGEVFKAFQALSDPVLMKSVSPPFTFDFAQLLDKSPPRSVYLMVPAEFVGAWRSVIKAMLACAMIYKGEAPQAPPQLWILDEAGQLGAFPLIVKLFTYGAGIDIRPWIFVQSIRQLRDLGANAETIILSSAATRQFFGVRDPDTAAFVSRMCGAQTLEYDDPQHQERAYVGKQQAIRALLAGEDPLRAALDFAASKRRADIKLKLRRELRTPAEIINTPEGRQFIFTDGVPMPIHAERAPYYEQRFMAGTFHPNPYHPPLDRVRVRTAFGHRWRRIVRAPVPGRYAHLPQYRDGWWSYVEANGKEER